MPIIASAIPRNEKNKLRADSEVNQKLNTNKWATEKKLVFPEDIEDFEYNDITQLDIIVTEGGKFVTESTNDVNALGLPTPIDKQVFKEGKPRSVQTIYLPMPPALQTSTSTQWQGISLGVIGAKSTQVGAAIQAAKNAFKGGVGSKAAEDFKASSKSFFTEVASVIGRETLNGIAGITGINVGGAISLAQRDIVNPHQEVLFQGMNFRDFSFSWRLQPKSIKEVQAVSDIITTLRFHSAPQIGTSAGRKGFFLYPDEFELKFMHKDSTNGQFTLNKYLPKIAKCVLLSVGTNYTAAGIWSAFKNGAAVDVQLDLTFKEIELITQDKIKDGF